jgi:cytochrome bd ubiquinol oxidase subunit II
VKEMNDIYLATALLWGFVFIYSVAASIDFGTGFWSMFYSKRRQTKATKIANRFLSPSWKITNVFIVLLVVALVTFFPGATFTLAAVLLVPGSIILVLLSLRSAFMVYSYVVSQHRILLSYVSGITGILIPGLLISVLPISQGGFIAIENGSEQLLFIKLLTSFSFYAFAGFAISSTLFLSSLLLADYSRAADDEEAYVIYRLDAIIIGPITLLMAFLTLLTMDYEATWLLNNLFEFRNWLLLSVLLFIIGYGSLWVKIKHKIGMPRFALIAIVLQYLFASYAYGNAHLPYIVYPTVTVETGFTNPEMFRALFITYIVGFALLLPGFILFWRLFMSDKRYVKQED